MDADKKRKLDGETAEGDAPAVDRAVLEQSLHRVVSVLTKEQLGSLLVQAALKVDSIAEELMALGDRDISQRKLFVRGLSWETTSESLKAAFEQYGEIVEGAVVTDRVTGKSRGFGFITFKTMAAAHRALSDPSKQIDGRSSTCQLAAAGNSGSTPGHVESAPSGLSLRGAVSPAGSEDVALRKLYVWGLSYDTTNEEFLEVFLKYGEIEEGSVAHDKETHKSRGFGFVTYRTAAAAASALQEPVKNITGRNVNVKYAGGPSKAKNQGQYFGQGLMTGSVYTNPQQSASMYNPQAAASALQSAYAQQQQQQQQQQQPLQQLGLFQASSFPGMSMSPYLQAQAQGSPGAAAYMQQGAAGNVAAFNAAFLAAQGQGQGPNYGGATSFGGMNMGGASTASYSGAGTAGAGGASNLSASYSSQLAAAAAATQPGVAGSGLLGYSIPGLGLYPGT